MDIRIAILAACAGTLALAQADVARADYGAASGSKSPMSTTEFGPKPTIRLAQSRPWTHGQQPMMGGARFDPGSRRVDDPSGTMLDVATTRGRKVQPGADGNKGKAGQRDAWDHNWKNQKVRNGLPERGRKLQPGKTGKAAIFDRGQEIPMTSY